MVTQLSWIQSKVVTVILIFVHCIFLSSGGLSSDLDLYSLETKYSQTHCKFRYRWRDEAQATYNVTLTPVTLTSVTLMTFAHLG